MVVLGASKSTESVISADHEHTKYPRYQTPNYLEYKSVPQYITSKYCEYTKNLKYMSLKYFYSQVLREAAENDLVESPIGR